MTSVLMSLAYADEGFETLVFKSATGESYCVDTRGLEMYFKDGKLTFSNTELTIPVASLVSMEFSDNSGVGETLSDSDGTIEVFTVDGIRKGEFSSLQDANGALKKGLYIVRLRDGKTFKIRIVQ